MKRLTWGATHIGIAIVCLLGGGYGDAQAAEVTFPFSGNMYFETNSTKNQYIYIPATGALSFDPSLLTEIYSAPDQTYVHITDATGDGVSFTLNVSGLPTFSISPPTFYPSWATLAGGEVEFSLNSRFYPTSPASPPPGTVSGFVTFYPLTSAGPFFSSLPATSIPNPQNVGIAGVSANGQGYQFLGTGAAIATDQYASPCINDGLSGGVTCAGSGLQVSQPTDVDLTKTTTPNLVVGAGGGTGTLAVGPATLTASSITLGGANEGDAIVQSGGKVQAQSLAVGSTASGSLSVNSGAVNVTGGATVADAASGTLAISNGGGFTTASLTIGNHANSNGTVSVDGTGSALTSKGNVIVGNSGTGTLSITNGATVSVTNGAGTTIAANPRGSSRWMVPGLRSSPVVRSP